MNPRIPEPLVGAEIHGFHTTSDLDVEKLMEDASTRWLRPNEVHAMLSNYTLFKVQPQPVDTPQSGKLLFFDRKMLRNFRKDGHNWKKKKDGKTVQEAHEKLKIGNEERIHVYYARNEDDPNFCRRCYWLLDKNLERIVLVHYRRTTEENDVQPPAVVVECADGLEADMMDQGSPKAPVNSAYGSDQSEMSPPSVIFSEELASNVEHGVNTGEVEQSLAKPDSYIAIVFFYTAFYDMHYFMKCKQNIQVWRPNLPLYVFAFRPNMNTGGLTFGTVTALHRL